MSKSKSGTLSPLSVGRPSVGHLALRNLLRRERRRSASARPGLPDCELNCQLLRSLSALVYSHARRSICDEHCSSRSSRSPRRWRSFRCTRRRGSAGDRRRLQARAELAEAAGRGILRLEDAPPPPAEREAQAAARRATGQTGNAPRPAGQGPTNQPGISGVAIDAQDRIYVFNRGAKPVMVFDTAGNLVGGAAIRSSTARSSIRTGSTRARSIGKATST